MASPGDSTPFRPLLSGPNADAVHRQFLRSFGFTRRDIVRIKQLAEATERDAPAALDNLDVPFRVGACMPGQEWTSSGQRLGEWAGRTLLWWPMNEREAEIWRQRRRTGPKPV